MNKEVEITSFKMPFWNMVWFIIKWTLASIVAVGLLLIAFIMIMTLVTMIMGESVDFGTTAQHYSSHFYNYHHSK